MKFIQDAFILIKLFPYYHQIRLCAFMWNISAHIYHLFNFSYFEAFLCNIKSIGPSNLLKLYLSRQSSVQSVLQRILAYLGTSLMSANSPKYSLFLYLNTSYGS